MTWERPSRFSLRWVCATDTLEHTQQVASSVKPDEGLAVVGLGKAMSGATAPGSTHSQVTTTYGSRGVRPI